MRRLLTVPVLCMLLSLAAPAAQAHTLFDTGEVAVVPSQHPAWVQAGIAPTPLYTADTGTALALRLPRNTFLRVLGTGSARLEVESYDDSGNPGARGWVEANQVLPSAPATDWLVSSVATVLWNAADPGTTAVRNLDPFTPLQRLDGPVQGRLQVRVYRSDFSSVVDQGWIDAANTGPALPPQVRVPSPTDRPIGLRSGGSTNQQQSFLDATAQAARDAATLTGVPASVTVAQAILESDWGRSGLAVYANNYFGMKAMGTLGNDGVIYMQTSEYDADGELYETTAAFRAYKSLGDSLADHDRLLETASRYAQAMRASKDPQQFAALLADAGYSTDPAYAAKLVSLMDRYNLYLLDA